MKKNLKYFAFLIFLMSMILLNVKADVTKCYYNYTGLLEPGKTLEESFYFEVQIPDNGDTPKLWDKNQKFVADIQNWNNQKDEYTFVANNQYVKDYGCPQYLTYYVYQNARKPILIADDNENNIDAYLETFKDQVSTSAFDYFKLIDENGDTDVDDKETSKKRVCDYGYFEIYYNSNNQVVYINSKDSKTYYPTIQLNYSSVDLCQTVHVCQPALQDKVYLTSEDDFFPGQENMIFYNLTDTLSPKYYGMESNQCEQIEPKSNKAEAPACSTFSNIFNGENGLKETWKKYNECLEKGNAACLAEEKENYNNQKNKIKNWCKEILSYADYSDSCLKNCLELDVEINKIEGNLSENGDTCGISGKVIIWVANIIRWVKYIVPVIVIVLGILDFIKAVGADKDDEMKKAQGRFVKRLIAAALIFLIPLIIGFILEITGFDVNGCGIIKL